jgi:polyisoprenoid-binding protein YceI
MKRIAILLVSTLAAPGVPAEQWCMQEGSELLFEATWESQTVPGRFRSFDVQVDTDDESIVGSRLTVAVQLEGADMDDPDINEAIVGAEWFAVDEHPAATFTSDAIEEGADGNYRAPGHLELKGVRLPVTVPFRWSESGDRAEMSGDVVIDRTRFNVGSGEWASGDTIGTDVRVSFTVILQRQ